MLIHFLAFIGVLFIVFSVFVSGFLAAAEDARQRLNGNKPVDHFWSSRGMK